MPGHFIDSRSRLVQKVQVRRGDLILGEMPTRSLIDQIQEGNLRPTDEFSGEGSHWAELGRHPQLKNYFPREEFVAAPPGIDQTLQEMADLLADLGQR